MDFRSERRYFSEDIKRSVVARLESGAITVTKLKSTYGILGNSTISRWCQQYGKKELQRMKKSDDSVLEIRGDDEKVLLRNQIKVLEDELKEARWKQATLETLIDVAERHYSIVIKKNSGQKR